MVQSEASFHGPFCAQVGVALLEAERTVVDAVGSPLVVARDTAVSHNRDHARRGTVLPRERTLPREHATRDQRVKWHGTHVRANDFARGVVTRFLVPHLCGMNQVQPSRDGRLGQRRLPNNRDTHALVARKQELPPRGRDPLGLALHAPRAMSPSLSGFPKGRPFLERQTQLRIRQWTPAMGMGRRHFFATVPRTEALQSHVPLGPGDVQ